MGLAAVAENRRQWDAAREQYQKVLDDAATPKPLKDLAAASISRLEMIRKPPLLAPPATAPTTSIFGATQPATQPSTTQVVPTQPSTKPDISQPLPRTSPPDTTPAPTPPATDSKTPAAPQPATPTPPQPPQNPG
jgi:hypothetical protein